MTYNISVTTTFDFFEPLIEDKFINYSFDDDKFFIMIKKGKRIIIPWGYILFITVESEDLE